MEHLPVIKAAPLFQNIEEAELFGLLGCLRAKPRSYEKGAFILRAGEPVTGFGMVLVGRVQVTREDLYGTRTLLTQLGAGDLFAEAFAFAFAPALPVSVEAASDCAVLFFDHTRLISPCANGCAFHTQLIRNMMGILARKNLMLNSKIQHISRRTTREKLLSYLNEQAHAHKSAQFIIPFDRQELADYLCVERSAMSAELSRLQKEGVLSYHKSAFKLHAKGREDA